MVFRAGYVSVIQTYHRKNVRSPLIVLLKEFVNYVLSIESIYTLLNLSSTKFYRLYSCDLAMLKLILAITTVFQDMHNFCLHLHRKDNRFLFCDCM